MKTQLLKRVRKNYNVFEFINYEDENFRFVAYNRFITEDAVYSNNKQKCIDWIKNVVRQKYFLYFYITNSRRRSRKSKPTMKKVWYEPQN